MFGFLSNARRLRNIEAYLIEIRRNQNILGAIQTRNQETIMSGLTAAQAALTNLTTATHDTLTYIASLADQLKNAAPQGDDDNAVQGIADQINAAVAGLRQGIADAQAKASAPGMGVVTNTALPADAAPPAETAPFKPQTMEPGAPLPADGPAQVHDTDPAA